MVKSAQLESLDIQELQDLQSLYRGEWPKYCQEFYSLKNFIAFVKVVPELKHLKAFTLKDQQLGLFLIVDRYQLFVGCLGDSLDLLEQALHLLDWSRGLLCTSIPDRYMATIFRVVQEKHLKIEFHHLSNVYHMPAEQAQEFQVDCPEGFHLQSLTENDAHLINQEWAYSHEGSLYFMQRQVRLCPSMGLYDDQTQELVAWCIRTQDGFLAALQVKNTHQRLGFGSLLVQSLSQRIAADLGDDVTAEVYPQNLASVHMFDKLGFRVIGQCHWLNIEPTEGAFTWPEGQ